MDAVHKALIHKEYAASGTSFAIGTHLPSFSGPALATDAILCCSLSCRLGTTLLICPALAIPALAILVLATLAFATFCGVTRNRQKKQQRYDSGGLFQE
jgi:hypothetical protein